MKNTILLTFMMLFASAGILSAQPNPPDYYTGKTRISGDGYVYEISHYKDWFRVNNTLNNLIIQNPPQDTDNIKLDINYITSEIIEDFFKSIAMDEIKMLSTELKNRHERDKNIEGWKVNMNMLRIRLAFNPRTGRVIELCYDLIDTPASKAIHPDKLFQLEQFVKENLIAYDAFPSEDIRNEAEKFEWVKTTLTIYFHKLYPL